MRKQYQVSINHKRDIFNPRSGKLKRKKAKKKKKKKKFNFHTLYTN